MLFNSDLFLLVFLPFTLAGFIVLAGRWRLASVLWLVAASLAFYGWWNPLHLWVPVASALFNFGAARAIAHAPAGSRSRWWRTALGIATNVGFLAYFKALNSAWLGAAEAASAFTTASSIAIPLGVSFITFQQIAFLVDVHRGRVAQPRAAEYALFLLFFPKLVMGPIVHYRDIAPQLSAPDFGRVRLDDIACGIAILAVGLFKKVVIADGIAPYVDRVFEAAAGGMVLSPADAFGGAVAFQLQIYFDFSGYADMAIGLARLFGLRLPINFDAPMRATDRFDLWRRWHITFGAFMRQYVFYPLARNRVAPLPVWAALFITALVSGLWHGFGWTFLAWGLLQAAILVGNHAAGRFAPIRAWRLADNRSILILRIAGTFLITAAIGVLFRAPDLATAGHMLARLTDLGIVFEAKLLLGRYELAVLMLAATIVSVAPTTQSLFGRVWTGLEPRSPRDIPVAIEPAFARRIRFALTPAWGVFVAALLFASFMSFDRTTRNVYFQF